MTEYHCKFDELVEPSQLKDHPRNYNKHPRRQLDALSAVIWGPKVDGNRDASKALGWRHAVVVSKRSGFVVMGHARKTVAIEEGELVPVVYQDFESEAMERAQLAADNRLAELSEIDIKLLNIEVLELETLEMPMDDFGFERENKKSKKYDKKEKDKESKEEIFAFKEDSIFKSNNQFGIPDLDPCMLANIEDVPNRIWSGGEFVSGDLILYTTTSLPDDCSKYILGFYIDDYRFEQTWSDAVIFVEKLSKYKFKTIIAPDFSTWRDDPFAVQLFNRYRSMWVARYWQKAGFKIIPSLSWSDERSYDFCCSGIPYNCDLVSLQCRTTKSKLGKEYFMNGINETLNRINPKKVIIYGGITHKDWIEPILETKSDIVWMSDFISERRKK